MNRGTWARVHAVRQVIKRLINTFPEGVNVVSLGAGYDSTFFWLKQNKLNENVCYVEIDYTDVVMTKIKKIK